MKRFKNKWILENCVAPVDGVNDKTNYYVGMWIFSLYNEIINC
jgi:hypothetical protein